LIFKLEFIVTFTFPLINPNKNYLYPITFISVKYWN